MYNSVFIIILSIVIFGYLLERILTILNSTKWSTKLPQEVSDVYDPGQYRKSQQYKRANDRFEWITSSFSLVVILLMLLLGGFSFVDNILRGYTSDPILLALLFFGILMFASDIINTPFSIYDTFIIEEKYGFNKTTVRTFILDKIKGWLLALVIGGGLLALVVWFYKITGTMFWVYAWIAVSLFSIFMAMFHSTLIVPLFNKQTPLEEGDLKDAINDFCRKVGFSIANVYVIDGSKRSKKAFPVRHLFL